MSLPGDTGPLRVILNWYGNPATTAAVTWRTLSPAANALAQIQTAQPSPLSAGDATEVKAVSQAETVNGRVVWSHSVRFTGLIPGTVYAYRVGDGKNWTEWSQFHTAAETFQPFRFIYLGDLQNELSSQCSRVVRAAVLKAPDALFMAHAGDLVTRGRSDALWSEWFAAGGWIYRTFPQIMVPGNHEYLSSLGLGSSRLTPLWRPQFTLPENGPPGMEERSYTLDIQGVRLVALDMNIKLEEQAHWLDRVLKAPGQHRWTILLMHQPLYSTGRHRNNTELRRLFLPVIDANGVDLVLQGHDHTYGRTWRLKGGRRVRSRTGGTVYVVSVAGPKQYSLNPKFRSLMARMAAGRQFFQVISLERDFLQYDAWTADGGHFDHFVLHK